jgi:hypothetical protein
MIMRSFHCLVPLLLLVPFGSSVQDCRFQDYSSPDLPRPEQWQALADRLSPEASLFDHTGESYRSLCKDFEKDDWITDGHYIGGDGEGYCMVTPNCRFEFCAPDSGNRNLPAYTVDVRTRGDIEAALEFANTFNMAVSIKTTGHSFQGSSTGKDSLNIWMRHYKKDGSIQKDYQDSCGKVWETTLGVGGGEVWDDVFEAVGDDYHVVSGDTRSVSAAGGWLQGVGLSHTCRKYGLGIDNVVGFSLVLPNGTSVYTDGCTNPDLFWALRGGGGGTFGVVTHARIQLHPPTKVTYLYWDMDVDKLSSSQARFAIRLWLDYWAATSPTLDNRVGGSWFGPDYFEIFVLGDVDTAYSLFLYDFTYWMENVLMTEIEFNYSPTLRVMEHDSWYRAMGGHDKYKRPVSIYPSDKISTRLVPESMVLNERASVVDFLTDLAVDVDYWGAYWLGGVANDVGPHVTAVHPSMREAVWAISTTSDEGGKIVREYFNNEVSGCSFNHHSATEPQWREALWGREHYDHLLEIKDKYDPNRRLNCWHCVGYQGPEIPGDKELPFCPPTAAPSEISGGVLVAAPSVSPPTNVAAPSVVAPTDVVAPVDVAAVPATAPTASAAPLAGSSPAAGAQNQVAHSVAAEVTNLYPTASPSAPVTPVLMLPYSGTSIAAASGPPPTSGQQRGETKFSILLLVFLVTIFLI